MPSLPRKPCTSWRDPLPADALEGTIQRAILSAVNRLPYARLWRNNVGMLKDATGVGVTYGLAKGSADLIGIVHGRFVAIEVKRPGKKPTDDQREWGETVLRLGGVWAVCSDVESALALLDAARPAVQALLAEESL